MTYYELTPAYRDYKSAREVTGAWRANADFHGDWQLGFQLVSREDMLASREVPAGFTVNLRYARNTKLAVVREGR